MDDFDQFLGGYRGGGMVRSAYNPIADVVLDHLGDKAIQRATTGGRLLQELCAACIRVQRPARMSARP